MSMAKLIDMSGKRIGMTVVLGKAPKNKWGHFMWELRCDCGKIFISRASWIRRSNFNSCGCDTVNKRNEALVKINWNRKAKGFSGETLLFNTYKKGAKKRKLTFNLTREDFSKITKNNCFYCGALPSNKISLRGNGMSIDGLKNSCYVYNGIDRINNEIGYEIENVLTACFLCNRSKFNSSKEEFLNHCLKIVNHLNLKNER